MSQAATTTTTTAVTTPALVSLAHEARALTLANCPQDVQRQAGLCILDTLGCIVAGTQTEEARLVLATAAAESGESPSSAATVFGTHRRASAVEAIRSNGYLGDVLELNDLIGGHASIGIVSAALAVAEALEAGGTALLEAVIRGIEVTSRIYDAVYPSLKRFTECGLVPVGIPSSIGAAAAVARLLELDEAQTAQAMAIAGATAGWCPAEVIFGDGGTVKPMLFGAQPGSTGLAAAMHAKAGMTGPLHLLDSKFGYFATVANEPRLETGPWAEHWALARPRRKLHACCGYLHSALDAAVALRRRLGPSIADAVIDVHVPGYTADVVSKSRPPVSATDARFHLQYCLALALTGVDVIEPQHSIAFAAYLARPELSAAMARVRVVIDPSLGHYHRSRLVATAPDGTLAEQAVDTPRGSPGDPLSDAEVVAKFMRLVAPVVGAASADRFAAALPGLAALPRVGSLMRSLAL